MVNLKKMDSLDLNRFIIVGNELLGDNRVFEQGSVEDDIMPEGLSFQSFDLEVFEREEKKKKFGNFVPPSVSIQSMPRLLFRPENGKDSKPLAVLRALKLLERVVKDNKEAEAIGKEAFSLRIIEENVETIMQYVGDKDLVVIDLLERCVTNVEAVMEKFRARDIPVCKEGFWNKFLNNLLSFFVTIRDDRETDWTVSVSLFERLSCITQQLSKEEVFMKSLLDSLHVLLVERTRNDKNLFNGKSFYLHKLFEMVGALVFEISNPNILKVLISNAECLAVLLDKNPNNDLEYMYLIKIVSTIAKLKTLKELNVI